MGSGPSAQVRSEWGAWKSNAALDDIADRLPALRRAPAQQRIQPGVWNTVWSDFVLPSSTTCAPPTSCKACSRPATMVPWRC
jgi:hypothetical protein